MKLTPFLPAPGHDLGAAYNDLRPLEIFQVRDEDFNEEESFKSRWTNVWIGGGGATSHCHFDVYHNFYIQIYGRKRFLLFPPEEHTNLYLYPYLHPASLQSQVDFENPNYKAFPNFKNAKGIQAILNPGVSRI
jgi:lysine-specific demethylase 8